MRQYGIPESKALEQYGATNCKLLDTVIFQDIVGSQGAIRLIQHQRPINLLIVSVLQGGVNIYFGDYTSLQLPLTPHLHFGQTNTPEWLPIPEGWHTLTAVAVGNSGQQVLASIICGGP